MINLENIINSSQSQTSVTPEIFDLQKEIDLESLSSLFKENKIQFVNDNYKEQLSELYAINNPSRVYTPLFDEDFDKYFKSLQQNTPIWKQGVWVYYPWLLSLVHILLANDFYKVRTARNHNLITVAEQEKFYNATIGIAGLSVGNSIALSIVLQGGGKRLKLADFDTLNLSNTNRLSTGVQQLGLSKVEMTARQIYERDPYAEIDLYRDGLTVENIEKIFTAEPKLDIIIDEIDNLSMKYKIREYAKKYHLPVVMAADNGDGGVIDIERYDQDQNLKYFHGLLGDLNYDDLKQMDKFQIGKTIAKYVGPENTAIRMIESLSEMGKSLVSWPQLGGAAILNGSLIAYCVRRILNNQPVIDRRALVSMDDILDPTFHSPAKVKKRQNVIDNFKKQLDII